MDILFLYALVYKCLKLITQYNYLVFDIKICIYFLFFFLNFLNFIFFYIKLAATGILTAVEIAGRRPNRRTLIWPFSLPDNI